MTTRKKTNKPNRLRGILLLPIAIFIFIIGWSLIWLSSNKKPQKPNQKQKQPTIQEDNVTLMAIPHEEEQEIIVNNQEE